MYDIAFGLCWIVVATLAPVAVAARVYRHLGSGQVAAMIVATTTPLSAFFAGGAFWTIGAWLERTDDVPEGAMPPRMLFLMTGAFSVMFAFQGMLFVVVVLALVRLVNRSAYASALRFAGFERAGEADLLPEPPTRHAVGLPRFPC